MAAPPRNKAAVILLFCVNDTYCTFHFKKNSCISRQLPSATTTYHPTSTSSVSTALGEIGSTFAASSWT